MKSRYLGMLGAAVLMLTGTQVQAAGELHLYNWGNYTNPVLIEKFEKEYDIKVTIDSYDSNETLLAKIKSGATGYDLVVPSDYMVAIMISEDLLAKTDPHSMENYGNVDPNWTSPYWDPNREYSVPYQWGSTSFGVNTAVYDGDIDTLAILYDPPEVLKGRINMLLDSNEVINSGLRYLGLPRCNENKEDLKKLNDLLLEAKKNWRTMAYETIEKITSGDVDVTQNWNGASMRARAVVPTIKYAYPREGYTGWMDNVAALKDAPNLENAKLFMNFVMTPEHAAMISDFAKYANGIVGSEEFMDPEFANAPEIKLPADAPAPEFVPPCNETVVKLYDKIWTNLQK